MKRFVVVFFLILASQAAWANYSCVGKIKGTTIRPNGQLYVESIGASINWVRLCSISQDYNNVKQDTCKGILSTLLTAQTTAKKVRFWFNDGGNCTTHAAWNDLSGWYFGPKLED